MKIETLLPLNRESRDQDHQPLIQGSSYSLWVGLGGGQLKIVAQHLMVDGSEPLQRSGYQQCLSIVISNANGSANRSREIELAQCWLLVPPVESQVPPAWTCVDTAGHEDKPGGHWVVPACVPAYVTGARGVDTATTRGATGVCAASRIRIRPQRFLSEFIRGL